MSILNWLPRGVLNEVDVDYPDTDVTKGITPVNGLLGRTVHVSNAYAKRHSKSGTILKGGHYTLARLDPAMVAAIGTAVRGRPVFWVDKDKTTITCDAATTSIYAGVLIETVTAKGNVTLIFSGGGEAGGLFRNPISKTPPTTNDNVTLDIAGGVATFDVLADGTALTTTNFRLMSAVDGKVVAAAVAGAVSNILFAPKNIPEDGLI